MKFYQKRGFALLVLILAIVGAGAWGLHKKPADLPEVRQNIWLLDDADILSEQTEELINEYNATWDEKYLAVMAVVTVDNMDGWTYEKYADAIGERWQLGQDDLLLLIVKDQYGYIRAGDRVWDYVSGTNLRDKLNAALNQIKPSGDVDGAVVKIFRQADVVFAQNYQNITKR